MTTEREENETDTPTESQEDTTARIEVTDVESLKAALEDEREKAQTYMQNWQRAAADFQNYKRRVEDERSEMARLANAALIINLLPLGDDFERAFTNIDAHVAGLTWVDGIRLIQRKLQAIIEMAGVTEIAADGETFDPALHEAVSQGPGEENKVIAVVQKGYRLGDRVIRPAMVVVGAGEGSGTREAGSET
jgi:molecular chaperone GrpE